MMPSFQSTIDRIASTNMMDSQTRRELRDIDIAAIALVCRIDDWAAVLDESNAKEWWGHVEPAVESLRHALGGWDDA